MSASGNALTDIVRVSPIWWNTVLSVRSPTPRAIPELRAPSANSGSAASHQTSLPSFQTQSAELLAAAEKIPISFVGAPALGLSS